MTSIRSLLLIACITLTGNTHENVRSFVTFIIELNESIQMSTSQSLIIRFQISELKLFHGLMPGTVLLYNLLDAISNSRGRNNGRKNYTVGLRDAKNQKE